ncbi:MAG TPA: hypothetical protein VNS09_14485 [Solirubrobacter sp.]|nr:hypothetical protein [Solirubrobacter sp.]
MLRWLALTAVAFSVLATPAVAAQVVDAPAVLADALPDAQKARIPVLVPSRVNLDYKQGGEVFAAGDGSKRDKVYSLTLSAAKNCTGNACFLAEFTGEKGKPLGYRSTNVSLALGQKGYYTRGSCGASCAPPSIQWVQKGVRYEIQAKALGGKAAFVKMANSAIRNGNRK